MSNKEIIRRLRLAASLMELHNENVFKIRSYQNAQVSLERISEPLEGLEPETIGALDGVGKSIATAIGEILATGSFKQLNELLERTPEGVVAMMSIKGLGPKKVGQLWRETGIESTDALLKACESNLISKIKGFGDKTQETIKQALLFAKMNEGKVRFADIEIVAEALIKDLQAKFPNSEMALSGQYRRLLEVIETLSVVISHPQPSEVFDYLKTLDFSEQELSRSGPFVWRGLLKDFKLPLEVYVCSAENFVNFHFRITGALPHLQAQLKSGTSLLKLCGEKNFSGEDEIYKAAGLTYVVPELREGIFEIQAAEDNNLPVLVEYGHLKGILHNHSTWSDGRHSLREMAEHCRDLGFEYLGISDHSRTASYAGGLETERVLQQQEEINNLNQELKPFRIFKGIESDILADGSLDYPEEILAGFDFIVASVHSNLNMSLSKATDRLIKAIQNPYTTILGHPTGRLVLQREGYPIDHRAVIEACAENGVIIEINANPWRLDIDWRWVPYAIEKGVMLSINPDAHEKDGYRDMIYGVYAGRKGGLTPDMTFNALPLDKVAAHFEKRKERAGAKA